MYYNSELWEDWERWIAAARARALPGVVDFVRYAQSKKVKVFFISNRVASQEAATRKNLQAAGLKLDENIDTILLRKEKPGWETEKGSRRSVVAEKHRILLLIGDNLGDFVDHYKTNYQEREKILNLEKYKDFWGKQWIVLPNPMYGSWEHAGYDFNSNLPRSQIRTLMKEKLIKWDGE
jgi:acid phosphatase